jgi:glycine/D-amino acid oxidase-like deaminating enzyme
MQGSRVTYASEPDALPTTADVVILGGGPAGTAAAWALHRADPTLRVALFEKSDRLGAGSSAASLEAYRSCWPCIPLMRQMQRSLEIFHHADDYLGEGASQAIALKQQGYLFCAFTSQQVDAFRRDVGRLHDIGLTHIELLEGGELRARFGWLGDRVIAAKFDPIAGWLDSNALIHRYAAQAQSARIVLGVEDTQICVEGGRITGVSTPHGTIASPRVVIAAGADARRIGRTAGIDLPIVVRPRQSFTTGWRHEEFPSHGPLVIGAAPYPHVRPEAQVGAMFGWEYGWNNKGVDVMHRADDSATMLAEPVYPPDKFKDPRFPSLTLALLARQFGHAPGQGFADPRYLRGVHHNVGYYVYRDASQAHRVLPDGSMRPYESERAIIDTVPGVDGLVVSVAHVGHGIMTSPASGEIAACKVLGQPLADPSFADFGFGTTWVEYDEAVL